ncbi:MAG: carboxypeptidase regulatory-like domain-containing protein, partial [Candidatus Cloacimonadaceae bacterium]
VVLTGDENPNNDETAPMSVTVMEAGLLVAEIGTGTATNTNTGSPTPYGTWYKAFRQQFLYTADDFFAAGAAPGLISALAFNVQSLDACTPMTNYRIRLKHTDQAALTATFELGDYTTVWQRDTFMPTVAWNIHNFDTPFMWDGASNLIVEIVTDMVATYDRNALVYFSTTDYASSVRYQSDSNNGLTGTTGTTSMNRSNIRFFMTVDGMGSINGTVTAGGSPLEGAEIAVENTLFTAVSGADGTYNLPFVPEGAQTVTASKHGYADVTHTVTVVEDQATTQDFALTLLPQVAVTGRIVGSDAPTLGIEGASITLSGYEAYEAITDASGQFSIPSVFSGHTYNYTAAAIGYAVATGEVEVGSAPVNMGDITVNEVAYAPYGVVATESDNYQSVNVSWEVPVPGGSSFEDDFESYDDFATVFGDWTTVDVDGSDTYGFSGISFPGSGSAMSYIIFNPTMTVPPLEDNPGHSGDKYAACFASTTPPNNDWLITPQVMGGGVASFWARTYMDYGMERFKVGVSTTGTAPADFTIISGANYVEAPLTWTEFTYDLSAYAGQQIYVGVQCVSNDCFIFFVDDFYVGDARIRTASESMQSSASSVANHTMGRTAERAIVTPNPVKIISPSPRNTSRALMGYKVYRLLAADQANENNWTTLTANTITPTQYADNGWGPLPSGVYKYAVKAVYTNDVMSPAAFSAELHKGMMGTLSGTVTEFGTDLPVEGANVSAGEYSGTTNASGEYSFTIYAGTYEVSASKPGYQAATQANVVIQGTQTTTVDFVLTEITLPPAAVQAEEAGSNVNLTWMAPGTAGGEWIHYDSGENEDSIGTNSAANFDVAVRYPPSALTEFAGMSLHALK